MSKHPYPEHVVEAVAEAMGRSRTGEDWGRFKEYFIEHTHVALQALWDASRVDNAQEASQLPDQTLLINYAGAFVAEAVRQHDFTDDEFPAHIVYWGDTDE